MQPTHRFSLFSLCGLLAFASCKEQQPVSSSLTVRTAAALPFEGKERQEEFPFITQPYRTSDLSFRVGGPVLEMDIHAGNFYRLGQTIATIDSRDFQVRRARTEAVAQQAKAEYLRVEALFNAGNIATAVYDKAKADNATAATAHQTTLNELQDTRLRAPFNGYVQEIYFERYQEIRPGQPVCSLIDIDRLKIETFVPQHVALAARQSQEVTVCFDALPDTLFKASVADVSKGTSKNNLSFVLTVILPNRDHRLLSGMSGKLYFENNTVKGSQGAIIPRSAVRNRPSVGSYVYVIEPSGVAHRRTVNLGGQQQGNQIEVKSGLRPGEIVAVSGCDHITDGQTVSETRP